MWNNFSFCSNYNNWSSQISLGKESFDDFWEDELAIVGIKRPEDDSNYKCNWKCECSEKIVFHFSDEWFFGRRDIIWSKHIVEYGDAEVNNLKDLEGYKTWEN